MDKIIAYCGLICTDCPAYMATQADNRAALEQVAAQWRKEFNAPNITVESIICDGCLNNGRKCSHCAECEIRVCGIERGVINCAHCPDYASCKKLQGFFGFAPQARATLDEIRQGLYG